MRGEIQQRYGEGCTLRGPLDLTQLVAQISRTLSPTQIQRIRSMVGRGRWAYTIEEYRIVGSYLESDMSGGPIMDGPAIFRGVVVCSSGSEYEVFEPSMPQSVFYPDTRIRR